MRVPVLSVRVFFTCGLVNHRHTPTTNPTRPTTTPPTTINSVRSSAPIERVRLVRLRGFAPGELEALLADPGEEISAATKQRVYAARQGLMP